MSRISPRAGSRRGRFCGGKEVSSTKGPGRTIGRPINLPIKARDQARRTHEPEIEVPAAS